MDKKVTLDELAAMVKRGFDEMNTRFGEVNGKLQEHDSRFGGIEQRLDRIESDVSEIKLKLPYFAYAMDVKALQERVARLEKKVGV